MTGVEREASALRIAELPAGHGCIGVTLCPGKQGPSLRGGPWRRDLATDVAAIRDWGASAVITLLEEPEFALLQVEELPAALRTAGFEWHHLPVRDVAAPDERFEWRWAYAGRCVRGRLRAGQRVLVHCRGGLGRAGSVAARLLVEFGAAPEAAIAAVRAVRPGAIETPEQEQWVRAQRPVDAERDARAERELACLLGGAIGDALGYRVEFLRWPEIRRQYGRQGIRLATADGPLIVSDDTQMTLFTLDGLVRAARTGVPRVEGIRAAYRDWYRTQRERQHQGGVAAGLLRHAVLWQPRAPGMTCLSALHAGGPGTIERSINDSKGCGGVMRAAPVGFLARRVRDAELYRQGADAAAITHGHPDGWAPAGVMALAVRQLLEDHDWLAALGSGLAVLQDEYPHASGTADLLQRVRDALLTDVTPRASSSFGEGWVADQALAVGLHAAATATDFVTAIETAANHDGDSDSTASIAGQLYGARHGLAALPADAVYRLDVLQPLLALHEEWEQVRGAVSADDRA